MQKLFYSLFYVFFVILMPINNGISKDMASLSVEERVDILSEEVDRLKNGGVFGGEIGSQYGFGPAASKVYNTPSGLSIGGYGEIVYKSYTSGDNTDETDAYRGVLYFGYKYNEEWSLNTELEFEHADESYLEFAYIDYTPSKFNGALGFRAGLLLLPQGLVNELHEPTLFHGTYRPKVETLMIPSTTRENGAGIFGELGNFEYKLYYVTSLKNPGTASSKTGNTMRNFRSKGSNSVSNEFATVGSLHYNLNAFGNQHLLGVSYYRGKIQPSGTAATTYDIHDALTTVHMRSIFAQGELAGFEYKLLYHQNEFDNVDRFNSYSGAAANAKFGEKQIGYYYEIAKNIGDLVGSTWYIAPFFRYENLDFHERTDSSATSNRDYQDNQYWNYGVSIKPIANIVIKADVLRHTSPGSNDNTRQFNLGIGYIF